MKKMISCLLLIALPLMSEESCIMERGELQGEAAGFASRDATVLSMMGWGISLAVGVAALVALIDNDHAHQD